MEYKSYTALIFHSNINKKFLKLQNNSGASLIATVLVLLIFALFIAIAVSLVTTGSNISLQEEQGTQSLFIADGGLEFSAVFNFPNHDGWPTPVIDKPLGAGTFTLTVPTLSNAIDTSNPITINVSSTDGFQTAPDGNYWIMLCYNITGSDPRPNVTANSTCEKISFTGKTTTPASFTGGTRGRDSSSAVNHLANAVVIMYSWNTSITTNLNGSSGTGSRICVDSTDNFVIPGLIKVTENNEDSNEDMLCQSIGSSPAVCGGSCNSCFLGCSRGAFSGGSGNNHGNNRPVYQSEISVLTTSTGEISNVLAGSITRRVQAALEPLQ